MKFLSSAHVASALTLTLLTSGCASWGGPQKTTAQESDAPSPVAGISKPAPQTEQPTTTPQKTTVPTAPLEPPSAKDIPPQTEIQRLQSLEEKTQHLNEQLEAMKSALDKLIQTQGPQKNAVTPAIPHPATESDMGVPAEPLKTNRADPEAGFVRDEAVNAFKTAIYLFKAEKYPESILAFAGFVDRYPDHPLAGSAQFYIGESYFRQKEYRLAIQEYEKVIASYDRASAVPQTLRRLAECKDELKLKEEGNRHRAMLSALFPNSPAMPQDRGALTPVSSGATGQKPSRMSRRIQTQLDSPPQEDALPEDLGTSPDGVRYDPHWGTQ